MHQFSRCKVQGGIIVPSELSKQKLFLKLLKNYEELNIKFKVTIEVVEKNINEQQVSLYKAFIISAHKHFGNTYEEMEALLKRFHPIENDGEVTHKKRVEKWSTKDLNDFIDQASVLLAEYGFKFK